MQDLSLDSGAERGTFDVKRGFSKHFRGVKCGFRGITEGAQIAIL